LGHWCALLWLRLLTLAVSLTLNYLSLLLSELERPSDSHEGLLPLGHGGLLIHCISGWDRTPLFVALLRLSLWANGRAHLSLSADEMVFFVIAYDWLLFGHDLHTRFSQSVELLYFSFFVLSKSAVPSNEERIGALFSSFLSSYGSIQY
jgi:myotubularin-related protein 14